MTRLLAATVALCALLARHFLCAHRARTTRPSGLIGPRGGELLVVECPHCKTHWTEYPSERRSRA